MTGAPVATASAATSEEAALSRLRDRAVGLLREAVRPDWLTPPRDFEFLRREAREHRATTLDERTGRKVPPPEIFAAHERLSFVGATNDQLAPSLRAAFDLRKKSRPDEPRWTEIEVFFLAKEALSWMTVIDRPAARLHDPESPAAPLPDSRHRSGESATTVLDRARRKAIQDLVRSLSDLAIRWTLFEYDAPFHFASFCDPAEPGGRVHVSPAIWGKDIRDCPADDYVRGEEAPSAKYRAYVDGLHALRRTARILARCDT